MSYNWLLSLRVISTIGHQETAFRATVAAESRLVANFVFLCFSAGRVRGDSRREEEGVRSGTHRKILQSKGSCCHFFILSNLASLSHFAKLQMINVQPHLHFRSKKNTENDFTHVIVQINKYKNQPEF